MNCQVLDGVGCRWGAVSAVGEADTVHLPFLGALAGYVR